MNKPYNSGQASDGIDLTVKSIQGIIKKYVHTQSLVTFYMSEKDVNLTKSVAEWTLL